MMEAVLPKARLAEFVSFLASGYKVIGPVDAGSGNYRFEEVESLEEMSLNHIPTLLPPKKYFLPQHETLLEYDVSHGQQMQAVLEVEDLLLFGVHTCDLAGIQCLNLVFSDRPRDLHYLIRKERIGLIGLECNDYCDGYANCAMVRNQLPKGGYDLFLTELDEFYFVHVNTPLGEALVEGDLFIVAGRQDIEALEALRRRKAGIFKSEVPIRYLDLPRLLGQTFDSQVWEDLGRRCLACGNCTNVCPTCYCFDVLDEPELDLTKGRRIRVWDSCQNEGFARVAGGESFRQKRSDRQRHRYSRKFRYPMGHYGRIFCTGCGRCSRTCMARIDLKATLLALMAERN